MHLLRLRCITLKIARLVGRICEVLLHLRDSREECVVAQILQISFLNEVIVQLIDCVVGLRVIHLWEEKLFALMNKILKFRFTLNAPFGG